MLTCGYTCTDHRGSWSPNSSCASRIRSACCDHNFDHNFHHIFDHVCWIRSASCDRKFDRCRGRSSLQPEASWPSMVVRDRVRSDPGSNRTWWSSQLNSTQITCSIMSRSSVGPDVSWNVKTSGLAGLDVRWSVKTRGCVDPGVKWNFRSGDLWASRGADKFLSR